jgi:hypothetical protein
VASLFRSNPIRDRIDQGEHRPQPNLSGNTEKVQMLKELVASIPKDINKRVVTGDRKELLKASRSFGVNKMVGTTDGHWMMKGMKTSLRHHQLYGTSWMVRRLSQTEAG